MSWAEDAKKRHDSTLRDAQQTRLDLEAAIEKQSTEFLHVMDRYSEIIMNELQTVGDAVWGHALFFPSYRMVYKRQVHVLENGSLLGRADWYVHSKAKTTEVLYVGKVPEGWMVTLLHTSKETVLREGHHGLYETGVTLSSVESRLREIMSKCIEKGPEAIQVPA